MLDPRVGNFLDCDLAWSSIDDCLHGQLLFL
jgi:hypothetical protein